MLLQVVPDNLGRNGLLKRYISRIVRILDVMNIVKHKEGKRIRYKKEEYKYGFITMPKVFADYRHFTKDKNGNQKIDTDYDYSNEILRQLEILENTKTKCRNIS